MVDFNKILKGANKNWNKAKKRAAESSSFQEFDDGRYTAKLVGAKLGTSDSGRNQIAFGWKFLDGDYEGKVKTSYQGIESEDNLYYLARDLERFGYELPDDLMDLPEILKDLEKSKPTASIVLKTKGDSDFQNVYIRKVFGDGEEEEGDEEEVESDDADESDDESDEEGDEEESDDAEESDDEESGDEDESDDEESDDEESDDEESDDEEEESGDDESDEEEVELETGMRVIAETAKGRLAGAVTDILESEGKVRVKLDNGSTVRVSVEKIEVEPEKAKKPAKKAEPKKTDKKPVKKSAPAKKAAPKKKGKK